MINFFYKIYGIIILCFLMVNSQAQSTKILTLDDAVKIGIENSKQLKLSLSKASLADERYQDYESTVFPSIKASAGYTRLSPIDPFSFLMPGAKEPITLFPVFLNSYTSQLSIYEPFYNGLRAKYTFQSQKFLLLAAKFDVENDRNEVVFNIINAYFNIYKISKSLAILDRNIEEIKEHIKETEDYEKQGLAIHNDVLKVQLQLSNAEFTKLDLQTSYDVASYNYSILLGLDTKTKISIDTAQTFSVKQTKSLDDYLKDAMNNRNDIKAFDNRNKSFEANELVTKGAYLPTVGVGGDFYFSNPNSRVIPPNDVFKATWDAGIYISYDVSSLYTNKHKVAQSKIITEQNKDTYDILVDNIKSEVNQNFMAYREATQKIELSNKTILQAEENYRTIHSRYSNHIALLSDVLDANISLLQAKMNLELANADSEIAYYKLMKSTGNTK